MIDSNDLNKKLQNMEEQIELVNSRIFASESCCQLPYSRYPASAGSDEIDLRELFAILWQGKWLVAGITFLFAVAGVVYALSLPDMYKSEGIYAPAQKQSNGGLGGQLAGQLGGIASLAGVSLGGGESNDIDQAMALVTSWPFLEQVIHKYDLKPFIMGVKGWNRETGELIWDEKVYDPVNNKWLRERPQGIEAEPSSYEVYEVFKKRLFASVESKTGLVSISFESHSPEVAKKILDDVIVELNGYFQKRDVSTAQRSIAFLTRKIDETSVSEMQSVFYGMIESQIKILMLAEVDEEHILKTIVGSKVSERRSSPNRLFILVVAIFFGGMVGCVTTLVVSVIKRVDK